MSGCDRVHTKFWQEREGCDRNSEEEGSAGAEMMNRRAKTAVEGGKVAFEVLAGRQGGEGIFGIEDEADEVARQTKLQRMAERIAGDDRGYEGKQRRCPRCGQVQRYKG